MALPPASQSQYCPHEYDPLPSQTDQWFNGLHLIPATGEFTYDTEAISVKPSGGSVFIPINTYTNGGLPSDYSVAMDNLAAAYPFCKTISVVVSWFTNAVDIGSGLPQIFPCTIYPNGVFENSSNTIHWYVSGLNETASFLSNTATQIPKLPSGASVYSGTPADQSIIRCIADLKSRGYRVVFYPFLLSTFSGVAPDGKTYAYPWRGLITALSADWSSAATTAIAAFFGNAAVNQFTVNNTLQTVTYSGDSPPVYDFTYRRMILHYAYLMTMCGGVDLFVLGSEMAGLEGLRGSSWTPGGTVSGGTTSWDYPFVASMVTLANDVRTVFNNAGLTVDTVNYHNLIAYSPDWSTWNGVSHSGTYMSTTFNGQWPHLDQLFASANINLVSLDNYMPLSDWTTGTGGRDTIAWANPRLPWPASDDDYANFDGLGLSGTPAMNDDYFQANIEGGEYFYWYYPDGINLGLGPDPNGGPYEISVPGGNGDRLNQTRQHYYPNQQLLGRKQIRWWWNNYHQACYDNGDGNGTIPRGTVTEWTPYAKQIIFLEYGFSAVDKAGNQPNVFFDPKSTQSDTPYWSCWSNTGGVYTPIRNDTIQYNCLSSLFAYWFGDGGMNPASNGTYMLLVDFCCVWNWDARPYPAFPSLNNIWGDATNYNAGDWIPGRTYIGDIA